MTYSVTYKVMTSACCCGSYAGELKRVMTVSELIDLLKNPQITVLQAVIKTD